MASTRNHLKALKTRITYGTMRDPESGLHYRDVRTDDGGRTRFHYRLESPADLGVIKQIFQKRDYDLSDFPFTADLRRYVAEAGEKSLLIVDAGANIGASAVYFSGLGAQFHVHAIEPEANNFRVLRKNVAGRRVVAEQAALAETCKTLWLQDPGQGDWAFQAGEQVGQIAVQAIDMPRVLANYDETFLPYICKIDIEGGEEYLFSANTDWVSRFALLVIELHDGIRPGTHMSRNFLRVLADGDFDICWRGENLFCLNNAVVKRSAAKQ